MPLWKQINNWRVFPRLFSLTYLYITYKVCEPIWTIPMSEFTTPYTVALSSVVGASAAWFKFYVESGNEKYSESE